MAVPVSEQILAIRERWHCKRHPFWDRLAEGELDIRHVGAFLAQHRACVHEIFASIGLTYTKSSKDIATVIVENLAEEAGLLGIDGREAHEHNDLIFRFTRYCGLTDEEVRNTKLLPSWYARAAAYWMISYTQPAIVRIAVQATQESQSVGIYGERVLPALTTRYGFTMDSPEIHFFVEHSVADVKHGDLMLELVDRHVNTPELLDAVLYHTEQISKLRWNATSELYRVTHLHGEGTLLPGELVVS